MEDKLVPPTLQRGSLLPLGAAAKGKMISFDRLWVGVEGSRVEEELTARKLAAEAGVAAVIVARAKIDQSYEPRMIPEK